MLKIITNNAFRLIGTSANAKLKERLANQSKIKAYSRIGKEVSFPYDMSKQLSKPNRTQETVDEAISRLNIPIECLKCALLWIYTITPEQQAAADLIAQNEVKKARQAYSKISDFGGMISYATLCFIAKDNVRGVRALNKFVEDDEEREAFMEFMTSLNGQPINYSEEEFSELLVDLFLESISAEDLLSIYENESYDLSHKSVVYIQKKESTALISRVEKMIHAVEIRFPKSADALKNCPDFLKEGKAELTKLSQYIGSDSTEYKNCAESIAKYIVRLVTRFYNEHEEISVPRLKKCLTLCEKSKSLAFTPMLRSEFDKHIQNLSQEIMYMTYR